MIIFLRQTSLRPLLANFSLSAADGGGSAAAPVFSKVTEGALRLLNVPPTELEAVAEAAKKTRGGAA